MALWLLLWLAWVNIFPKIQCIKAPSRSGIFNIVIYVLLFGSVVVTADQSSDFFLILPEDFLKKKYSAGLRSGQDGMPGLASHLDRVGILLKTLKLV